MKKILVSVLLMIGLSGCGGYWYEVESYETYETGSEIFFVEIDWGSGADLDLELITPYGETVSAYSSSWNGCEHLGDDLGGSNYGSEEIICLDPDYGYYDILIHNYGMRPTEVTLSYRLVTDDWLPSVIYEVNEQLLVLPDQTETIPTQL